MKFECVGGNTSFFFNGWQWEDKTESEKSKKGEALHSALKLIEWRFSVDHCRWNG